MSSIDTMIDQLMSGMEITPKCKPCSMSTNPKYSYHPSDENNNNDNSICRVTTSAVDNWPVFDTSRRLTLERRPVYEALITHIYQHFHVEKVAGVSALLDKYPAQEYEVYSEIVRKYNIVTPPAEHYTILQRFWYRLAIDTVYRVKKQDDHLDTNISEEVDGLMHRYHGNEHELHKLICQRYGLDVIMAGFPVPPPRVAVVNDDDFFLPSPEASSTTASTTASHSNKNTGNSSVSSGTRSPNNNDNNNNNGGSEQNSSDDDDDDENENAVVVMHGQAGSEGQQETSPRVKRRRMSTHASYIRRESSGGGALSFSTKKMFGC